MAISIMRHVKLREFTREDLEAAKRPIDKTIEVSYSIYPHEVVEHRMEDHHSRDRILGEATDRYAIVLESGGRILGTGKLLFSIAEYVSHCAPNHPQDSRRSNLYDYAETESKRKEKRGLRTGNLK